MYFITNQDQRLITRNKQNFSFMGIVSKLYLKGEILLKYVKLENQY